MRLLFSSMLFSTAIAFLLSPVLLTGQNVGYKVQTLERAAPKELSEAMQKLLSPQVLIVANEQGKDLAEVWYRKEIPAIASDAQLKAGLNYRAIAQGEFIGAIRFKEDAADYRKQKIKAGVYTLRLGYQPLDGDHAGSSQFTEFVLLLKATDDASPKALTMEELFEKSMTAAGTTHPAVFMLFPNAKPAADPQVLDKGGNHVVLYTKNELSVSGKSQPFGFGLTVVGSAP